MIHTSEALKNLDTSFENYHYQLDDGQGYKLTEGELQWLEFVKGKYSIYDHIISNSELTVDGLIYTIETSSLSQALAEDGMDCKAACLSDDSALQAIFFYSAYDPLEG
tara:strand:+ start:98 stop:421 length:324 start_codon:yes stop_codon:yes gene_type:complete